MRWRSGALALALGVGCVACGGATPASPQVSDSTLDGVARVGTAPIGSAMVARVAGAQALSPRAALDALVRDALLAQHARAEPALRARVAAAERALLARVVLEGLRDETARQPVTEADIRAEMERRWQQYARPAAARTIHAVVRFSAPADEARARAVAVAIRRAVEPATSAEEFRSAATAVPADGFEVKVEDLDPVTADGRLVRRGDGRLVEAFARAANALPAAGATSPVTRSEYGFHVIRLVERTEPRFASIESSQPVLEPELRLARQVAAHNELVRTLAAREVPVVSRAAMELTATIELEP